MTERTDSALPSYPTESATGGEPSAGDAPASPAAPRTRPRWPWIVLLVVGAVLVVAPLAGGMFYPAAQGQAMIGAFEPYTDPTRLDGFRADLDRLEQARAASLRLDAANGLDRGDPGRFAQIAAFQARYPAIDADMTDLLNRIDTARDDFGRMAALRPLDLVPFLPVGAGLVLIAAGVWGLRRRHTTVGRTGAGALALVVALALIAIPVSTSMVSNTRAADPLLDRFGSVVTTEKVREIQGYFVVLVGAVGQIDSSYRTAVDTSASAPTDTAVIDGLSSSWQRMSSDFAGLIGTMNDNVGNLRGVARLNGRTEALGFGAFAALPWFLIGAGALSGAAGLAGIARGRRSRTR